MDPDHSIHKLRDDSSREILWPKNKRETIASSGFLCARDGERKRRSQAGHILCRRGTGGFFLTDIAEVDSCQYFTVYGERGHENHAVIAMIARAFVKQDPYVVWGNGEQIRNWTHVSDIVAGTVLAAERIDDGTAVNLGTMERTRVIEAVHEVLRYTGHQPRIELHPEMPTGPMNRVADNALGRRLLGWEPKVKFMDGLRRTIDWYFSSKDRDAVGRTLETRLTER